MDALIVGIAFSCAGFSRAALPVESVILSWDANPEPAPAGYKVYYGTASGVYDQSIDVGNLLEVTVDHLSSTSDYFFVVTAYDAMGLESPPTSELKTIHNDAALYSVALSAGTLTAIDAVTFASTVPNPVASIWVTPTPRDGLARVSVNNVNVSAGGASQTIALQGGANTIPLVVTARDGVTSNSYQVVVTRLSVVETWRQRYFGTADAGAAADSAIPQHDGISNLMKFATGMDPTQSGNMPGVITQESGHLLFTYTRSKEAAGCGLTYAVEWTDVLNGPQWLKTGVTESSVVDMGATERVTVSVPTQAFAHLFVRLSIAAP